jgi:hypothetical protein
MLIPAFAVPYAAPMATQVSRQVGRNAYRRISSKELVQRAPHRLLQQQQLPQTQ